MEPRRPDPLNHTRSRGGPRVRIHLPPAASSVRTSIPWIMVGPPTGSSRADRTRHRDRCRWSDIPLTPFASPAHSAPHKRCAPDPCRRSRSPQAPCRSRSLLASERFCRPRETASLPLMFSVSSRPKNRLASDRRATDTSNVPSRSCSPRFSLPRAAADAHAGLYGLGLARRLRPGAAARGLRHRAPDLPGLPVRGELRLSLPVRDRARRRGRNSRRLRPGAEPVRAGPALGRRPSCCPRAARPACA